MKKYFVSFTYTSTKGEEERAWEIIGVDSTVLSGSPKLIKFDIERSLERLLYNRVNLLTLTSL